MTFPVLLPLNILGGNSSVELDLLTFGNVAEPKWLYAHAAIGILFFGEYTWSSKHIFVLT